MAADVLMNMDLDFEAMGGKRLIPLPSLQHLESVLQADVEHNSDSATEHSMAGMALHRLGEGARSRRLIRGCASNYVAYWSVEENRCVSAIRIVSCFHVGNRRQVNMTAHCTLQV